MKKNRLIIFLLAAIVAVVPAANGQTIHVAGASGSSQFLTAALGADQLALTEIAANVAKGIWTQGQKSTFHWTAKNSANIIDTRDPAGRILPEIGNVFVVWIADSSDSTGNTNVTDIWTAVSVDATSSRAGLLSPGNQRQWCSVASHPGGSRQPYLPHFTLGRRQSGCQPDRCDQCLECHRHLFHGHR